jgi:hypothetical protein
MARNLRTRVEDTEADVVDGTTYLSAGVESGRYHLAYRDEPEWGSTFAEFTGQLLRLAGFRSAN